LTLVVLANENFLMLTVAVLLSGPHRLEMLTKAIDSVPIDSPSVSELIIRHQGGPWNWGGALRERLEAHPKVRILEFPDYVDFADSFNRTLDAMQTPWGLILPDDDYLLRPAAKAAFETAAAHPGIDELGLIAFGWYYLQDGRYRAEYVARRDAAAAVRYTPKFCTTMMNLKRVRELGGFPGDVGGYCDTALYARLIFEFGALYTREPAGVYRLHEGQVSTKMRTVYAPYVDTMRELLSKYAKTPEERAAIAAGLSSSTSTFMLPIKRLFHRFRYRLLSEANVREDGWKFQLRDWSSD
jgi:hypothetical protein